MRASIGSSIISRLAGAVAALWLCSTGSVWAGSGGGADLGTLNSAINALCTALLPTSPPAPPSLCPQVPTVAQGVLQLSAWNLVPTEMNRATNNIALKGAVNAGNPSIPPVTTIPPITAFPVPAKTDATVTPPVVGLSDLLPNLTPLAFKGPDAIGKTVTLATNNITPVTSNMLNFASTKGLIAGQNYSIVDTTTLGAISNGTTLISISPTGTAVTMSANAAGQVNSGDKITLTPIATATQLYDTDASAFLYAVASLSASSMTTSPDTFYLLYEDLSLVNQTFKKNQIVAYLSLPLTGTTLDMNGNPSQVMTNLKVVATTCGGGPACLQLQAVGGMTLPTGINFGLVFAPSAFSTTPHAFFELQVPLVITNEIDPLYTPATDSLGNPSNLFANVPSPFSQPTNASTGIGPFAAPLCSGTPCPPATPPFFFSLCASLPGGNGNNGNGNGQAPVPAVAAYYAISTAGETLLSAPLNGFSGSVCPF